MKITLLVIGKTEAAYLKEGISNYQKRINYYTNFHIQELPYLKGMATIDSVQQKQKEGELILKQLAPGDTMVLLDERGKEPDSIGFSVILQQYMNQSVKQLVFVVGGAYGFSEAVYKRANYKLSLSQMTFSHQLIRLLFAEQLYRAFTILKGEPYHHG